MENLLSSLEGLLSAHRNTANDQYEIHVAFDSAISNVDGEYKANEYVDDFQRLLEPHCRCRPSSTDTYYGRQLKYKFYGVDMYIHLKDTTKVRNRKRASQLLYIHLILETHRATEEKWADFLSWINVSYLLLLDCDTQFKREAVLRMRNDLIKDPCIGAVSGRIHPIGSNIVNPWVWYQKFEYAAGQWLQKTTEGVLGCVLCCSGCFSMIRFTALYSSPEGVTSRSGALDLYRQEAKTGNEVMMLDQGEDRYLTTLLILNGWKVTYSANADGYTHCVETLHDLFVQRKRWIPSTIANLVHLLAKAKDLQKTNIHVSWFFIFYVAVVVASTAFSPAVIILVIIGGIQFAWPTTPPGVAELIGIGLPVIYLAVLVYYNASVDLKRVDIEARQKVQTNVAFVLMLAYTVIMTMVAVGVVVQVSQQGFGAKPIYILFITFVFIVAAGLHGEFGILACGVLYLLLLPTMYLVMLMFAVANLQDSTWGTRAGGSSSEQPTPVTFRGRMKELLGFLSTKNNREPDPPAPVATGNPTPKRGSSVAHTPKTLRRTKPVIVKGQMLIELSDKLWQSVEAHPQGNKQVILNGLTSLQRGSGVLLLVITCVSLILVATLERNVQLDVPIFDGAAFNFYGLALLFIFGVVLMIQYLSLLTDRLLSLLCWIAETPLHFSCSLRKPPEVIHRILHDPLDGHSSDEDPTPKPTVADV